MAVSKDKNRLLVVELKRGRASDHVAGQVLRYMGYVKDELAEPDQTIEGVIIGTEDDPKLQRALSMMPNVRFMRYRYRINRTLGIIESALCSFGSSSVPMITPSMV